MLMLEGGGWMMGCSSLDAAFFDILQHLTFDRTKESKFLLHYTLIKKKTGKNQMPTCYLRLVSC